MRTIVCDLRGVAADCATIDALARLQLATRRVGIELSVRNASRELTELLAFTGLDGALGLEPGREPEEREEPFGGEEERQLDDLSA
jgi:anti-anti-sigma regulatory factor